MPPGPLWNPGANWDEEAKRPGTDDRYCAVSVVFRPCWDAGEGDVGIPRARNLVETKDDIFI